MKYAAPIEALLNEYHSSKPGRQPSFFNSGRTPEGVNSYTRLAEQIEHCQSSNPVILDLACGDGILLQEISQKLRAGAKLIGSDMSQDELAFAKRRVFAHASEFVQSKAQSLPFADATFDFIFCHMAFMLMNPVEPVVREIARTLKPGACFVATISGAGLRTPADDIFMSALRPALLEENHDPFFQLCDSRTLTEEGLRSLFIGDAFVQPIQIEHFPVVYREKPNDLVEIFMLLYNVELLTPQRRETLRAELRARLPALVDEEGLVTHAMGLSQIRCQRK